MELSLNDISRDIALLTDGESVDQFYFSASGSADTINLTVTDGGGKERTFEAHLTETTR
jgi:hypothetical protein